MGTREDHAVQDTTIMSSQQASDFRAARDAEVQLLSRKPKYELVAQYYAVTGSDQGARFSRDELIAGILEREGFGIGKLNQAIHVLHHTDGFRNSACDLCQCQERWRGTSSLAPGAEVIVQCGLAPHTTGDHIPAGNDR